MGLCQKLSQFLFHCDKTVTQEPWVIKPDLEAKPSLEITNLTYFTISYFLWDLQDWIKTIINAPLNFSLSPSLHPLQPKHPFAFPLILRIFLSIPFSGEMNKDFLSILSSWWTEIHQKSAEEGKILQNTIIIWFHMFIGWLSNLVHNYLSVFLIKDYWVWHNS